MEKTAPGMCAPMAVNVTVRRPTRPREYLTEREIEKLIKAAGENRWGHRDATAILIAYRHGLRASELVALRWDDIDFQPGKLHVRRAKGGTASVHPIGGRELRALRRLKREAPASVYVFVSERLAPLSVAGWRGRGLPLPRSQPHAAAFLRLQARKRRPGHAGDPALPWSQVD
jgi:integrase